MTDPADALLRAIVESPHDDAPRLVYADCLEERNGHGDSERAEFIRVQCAIAALESRQLERFNEDTDWSQCTGIPASWCPNCGDCRCRNRAESMSDRDCPLHAPDSLHCCLEEMADSLERLRRRERELLADSEGQWVPPVLLDLVGLQPSGIQSPQLNWEYRRGFVASVTCTLADWYGEECGRCGGDGYVDGGPYSRVCRRCHGTGRVGGHGPAVVRAAPVEHISVSDKRPWNAGNFRWGWSKDDGDGRDYADWWILPPEIFDLMPSTESGFPKNPVRKWYKTEQRAIQFASDALLARGRAAAGLPPLPAPR